MDDPYFRYVEEQWSNIMTLYTAYEDRQPVVLFDIQEQKIYVYPYHGFLAELSSRSQVILTEQFADALVNSKVVVFVRDNENRRLVSYAVPTGKRSKRMKTKRPKARRQAKIPK